ncbi:hypothetical protein WN944_001402 [Citrus x changshan-huyou]|uniref:Uncharacterized protein n=1 Tax=Citrus x changshan-huyou TaxID=2935761 RepID=A0AAP0MEL1_9ROSI
MDIDSNISLFQLYAAYRMTKMMMSMMLEMPEWLQRISQNHQVGVMEMLKVIAALELKGVFSCIAPMPEKANKL